MQRWRRHVGLTAIAVALACVACGASAQMAPLYVVPTDDRLGVAVAEDQPLRLEFDAVDRERLLGALGPGAAAVGPATVRLAVDSRRERPFVDDGSDRWLVATFMVDHDQPAIAALRAEFLAGLPADAARPAALAAFVAGKLDTEHGHGWEPASQTARTLRGDCTEHAVLTAALARSLGIPARVVIGMVVLRPAERYATFGHAWAELRDGDHWIVVDAALGAAGVDARYVPLGLLEDEGPGFLLQMIDTLTAWVTRVVVPGPGG